MIYSWNQYKYFIVNIDVYGLTIVFHRSSAPENVDCGFAVDINHIPDMSTGIVIDPIECLVNGTRRHTPLFQKSYLQFRSRIINGDFINDLCQLQVHNQHSLVLML
jgi:hypothetical protein